MIEFNSDRFVDSVFGLRSMKSISFSQLIDIINHIFLISSSLQGTAGIWVSSWLVLQEGNKVVVLDVVTENEGSDGRELNEDVNGWA
jgi:hypothetical protein